jgi:hypothetical protein
VFACLKEFASFVLHLQIHGIWFFEEEDLQRVSALLNKILAQLPKPDAGITYIQHPEPTPVEGPPPAAAAHSHVEPAPGGSGGDGFWDRAVHVTESTLQQNQQLVPNNNLLDSGTAPVGTRHRANIRRNSRLGDCWTTCISACSMGVFRMAGPRQAAGWIAGCEQGKFAGHSLVSHQRVHSHQARVQMCEVQLSGLTCYPCLFAVLLQTGGVGGLQGLLKAAQHKHAAGQRPAASVVSPVPVPSSAPVEPAPSAGAAGLLTPAFFEQQQQRAKPQPPAAAGGSTPTAVQPSTQEVAAVTPPAGAANGPGGNPLQQLLSR